MTTLYVGMFYGGKIVCANCVNVQNKQSSSNALCMYLINDCVPNKLVTKIVY